MLPTLLLLCSRMKGGEENAADSHPSKDKCHRNSQIHKPRGRHTKRRTRNMGSQRAGTIRHSDCFFCLFSVADDISCAHDGARCDDFPPLPGKRYLLSLPTMPEASGTRIYGILLQMWTMSGLARLQESQTDTLPSQAITHSAKTRQPNRAGDDLFHCATQKSKQRCGTNS